VAPDSSALLRTAWGVTSLFLVESVVFGLAALPGLLTWRAILNMPLPWRGKYIETALIGIAITPTYFVFCVALMFLTALACGVLGWRAPQGRFPLKHNPWPVVKWARYNACTHVVRVFAGGLLRATPVWTWFLRLNGAKIGRGVHINSLAIYDHNLLEFGDGVVIGSDAKLSGHTIARSELLLAPVRLGHGVTIGTNSIVQPDVQIGDRTTIGVLSLVPAGSRLEPDRVYAGVPVQPIRPHTDSPTSPKA
jgi:acetyltransferase-like isoleucine patch superfamily enzyme